MSDKYIQVSGMLVRLEGPARASKFESFMGVLIALAAIVGFIVAGIMIIRG